MGGEGGVTDKQRATKLIDMLEGEKTDVLLNEHSYGRYAYDVAKKFLEQDAEIARLRKIEKAAIAVVNAESGEDIEDAVGMLESVMNGDWDFNPTEYAVGFLTSEVERLRGAIEKIANWNSVEVDEKGSEVALVNKVMDMRSIARQALEGAPTS